LRCGFALAQLAYHIACHSMSAIRPSPDQPFPAARRPPAERRTPCRRDGAAVVHAQAPRTGRRPEDAAARQGTTAAAAAAAEERPASKRRSAGRK